MQVSVTCGLWIGHFLSYLHNFSAVKAEQSLLWIWIYVLKRGCERSRNIQSAIFYRDLKALFNLMWDLKPRLFGIPGQSSSGSNQWVESEGHVWNPGPKWPSQSLTWHLWREERPPQSHLGGRSRWSSLRAREPREPWRTHTQEKHSHVHAWTSSAPAQPVVEPAGRRWLPRTAKSIPAKTHKQKYHKNVTCHLKTSPIEWKKYLHKLWSVSVCCRALKRRVSTITTWVRSVCGRFQ